MPFDKGSGTTVPQWAWDSVACVSVLLLYKLEFGRNDPGLGF